MDAPTYSIIIPVFNEERSIRPMYDRLLGAIPSADFEIIFVDDGSRDGTWREIEGLAALDERVRGLSFSRNFGHQVALTAGYDLASGKAVICLDGDLQQPPELIPQMIEKWREGHDIVLAIRRDSANTPVFKRITSRFYYGLINAISGVQITAGAADFRLMDRKVVDAFNSFRERNRFVRGIVSWMGFRHACVPYTAGEREFGTSRYSLGKMLGLAMDGILSFSSYPLKLVSLLGYVITLFAFAYIVYALFAKFLFRSAISGWTSLIVTVLFLGGIQLISTGIVGEYVGRIYDETKNRPLYIIDKKVGYR